MEEKKRKNTDYSASAVNLKNPIEVAITIRAIRGLQQQIQELQAKIEASIPKELSDTMSSLTTQLAAATEGCKSDIDNYGSYQDVENGIYALKQRKESINYLPILTRCVLPGAMANMVIEEAVNKAKLDGLVKGGLVTPEDARKCGEVKESFAYIIR